MSNKPKNDPVNYIVVGSRYQVFNEEGEQVPEFGVGVFRNGIRLDVAKQLYVQLLDKISDPWNAELKRSARELAATAFSLSEIFLEEVDKHFRRPPPPPVPEIKPNGTRNH